MVLATRTLHSDATAPLRLDASSVLRAAHTRRTASKSHPREPPHPRAIRESHRIKESHQRAVHESRRVDDRSAALQERALPRSAPTSSSHQRLQPAAPTSTHIPAARTSKHQPVPAAPTSTHIPRHSPGTYSDGRLHLQAEGDELAAAPWTQWTQWTWRSWTTSSIGDDDLGGSMVEAWWK